MKQKRERGAPNNLLSEIIFISLSVRIWHSISARVQSSLCLRGLWFLSTLLRRLLLLHLLITQRRQRTRNLLDLIAGQILRDLLGEFLQEDDIMCLLHIIGNERHERLAQLLKLRFCSRVEERKCRQINRGSRILPLNLYRICRAGTLARINANVTEKILGVLEIRFLLRTTKTFSSGGLVLATLIAVLGELTRSLCLLVRDTLGFGFFVCGG